MASGFVLCRGESRVTVITGESDRPVRQILVVFYAQRRRMTVAVGMNHTRQSDSPIRKSLLLSLGLALAAMTLQTGCVVVAAGAAGAGAVAYVRGELEVNLEHDLDAVFTASQNALRKLEFARINDHKSGVDAQLLARTALDKRVEITLTQVTKTLTKVQIRVGVLGDQGLSLTILEKIKAEL